MSFLNAPNFRLRLVSALVLIPLVLGVIWTGGPLFSVFVVMGTCLALYEWLHLARRTGAFTAYMVLGIVYILAVAFTLHTMRMDGGLVPIILLFALVWASDTDAYFTGKLVGGPKLGTPISPNKTWSGLIAAMMSPAILAGLYHWYFVGLKFPGMWLAVILGATIGFCAQGGDLSVSYLKRKAGVKDSGDLIPGHGGILDRIDSLMLCTPVFYMILQWFPGVFPL
jgi:phosphatidate cytidylyltransferase